MDNMNTSCFPIALASLKRANSASERIEELSIKSFTYKGTGTLSHTRTFPNIPKVIVLYGESTTSFSVTQPIFYPCERSMGFNCPINIDNVPSMRGLLVSYNGKDVTFESPENAARAFNQLDVEYTVYYI